MSAAATLLRAQIEAALADRIPSALTPAPRIIRPVASTGLHTVDEMLEGGLPFGAITELVGQECSGRTSLALSFLAQCTKAARICAWIDVADAFHPESAAAAGVDLTRLLWVRCGVHRKDKAQQFPANSFALPEKYILPPPIKKGLHGGGFGPHPRGEVKGLSDAVGDFLKPEMMAARCAEPQPRARSERVAFDFYPVQPRRDKRPVVPHKPWSRMEQSLRVADLLLQAGGFGAIVLDMGSIAPENVSRVPLATWFRYRAVAERTQASILLLTQRTCAKSSAALVLCLEARSALQQGSTVFAGIEHWVELSRQRFAQTSANVVPLRKPPKSERGASWQNQTAWAGRR